MFKSWKKKFAVVVLALTLGSPALLCISKEAKASAPLPPITVQLNEFILVMQTNLNAIRNGDYSSIDVPQYIGVARFMSMMVYDLAGTFTDLPASDFNPYRLSDIAGVLLSLENNYVSGRTGVHGMTGFMADFQQVIVSRYTNVSWSVIQAAMMDGSVTSIAQLMALLGESNTDDFYQNFRSVFGNNTLMGDIFKQTAYDAIAKFGPSPQDWYTDFSSGRTHSTRKVRLDDRSHSVRRQRMS